MSVFSFVAVAVVAFVVGVFGFSQIIGSLQNIAIRPHLIIPMVLWAAILVGGVFLELNLFPAKPVPLIVGYVIAFLAVISSGRIY